MEDETAGEKSCAYLVVKRAAASAAMPFPARAGRAEFKLPDRVECVASPPLTPVGKVDKNTYASGWRHVHRLKEKEITIPKTTALRAAHALASRPTKWNFSI